MRRFLIITAAIVLVLLGLYSVAWFYASSVVQAEIQRQLTVADAQGVTIERLDPRITGFPFSFGVVADDVALTHASGLSWSGGTIDGRVSIFAPTTVRIDIPTPQDFRLDPVAGGPPVTVVVGAARGFATATLDQTLDRARLDVDDVALSAPGLPAMQMAALRANVQSGTADDGAPALGIDVVAQSIGLDPSPVPGLGALIDSVFADLVVVGPVPTQVNARQLAAWRDADGLLRIETAGFSWGEVSLRVTGDLMLNEDLQPEGTLTVTIRGHGRLIDAAIDAGLIGAAEAGLASFGLAALARPDENGVLQIQAPLTVRNRAIQVGGVPLPIRLPPIAWPR